MADPKPETLRDKLISIAKGAAIAALGVAIQVVTEGLTGLGPQYAAVWMVLLNVARKLLLPVVL